MESESPNQGAVYPVVLVAGATGHAGRSIVKELLQDGHYRVRVLTRNKEKALALFGRTVDIEEVKDLSIQGGRSDLQKDHIWEGVEIIVSALGPANRSAKGMEHGIYSCTLNLVKHAYKRRIKTYAHIGAAGCSQPYSPAVMLHNVMNRMELHWHYKAERAIAVSGVNSIIIRPRGMVFKKHDWTPEAVVITQGDAAKGGKVSTVAVASVLVKALSLRKVSGGAEKTMFEAANNYYAPHIPDKVTFEVSAAGGTSSLDGHQLEHALCRLQETTQMLPVLDHFEAALYTKIALLIILVLFLLLLAKLIF